MSKTKAEHQGRPDSAQDGQGQDSAAQAEVTAVTWDDSAMQSSFANVINVINTREEFSLFFGQNETWDLSGARSLTVKLGNRIVMSPYGVKRLHVLLGDRLAAYEARFGALDISG